MNPRANAPRGAETPLNEFALEEAALALMQMRGGPGVPRRDEARVAVESYLYAAAIDAEPAGEDDEELLQRVADLIVREYEQDWECRLARQIVRMVRAALQRERS